MRIRLAALEMTWDEIARIERGLAALCAGEPRIGHVFADQCSKARASFALQCFDLFEVGCLQLCAPVLNDNVAKTSDPHGTFRFGDGGKRKLQGTCGHPGSDDGAVRRSLPPQPIARYKRATGP